MGISKRSAGTMAAFLLSGSFLFRQAPLPVEKSPPSVPAASSSTQTNLPKMKDSNSQGPWTPFCEHDAVESSSQLPAPPAAAKQAAENSNRKWTDCKPTSPVSFIVASVPDPEQTHLSLDFDRYVESLAWAVSDSDYSLESYWFPWQARSDQLRSDKEETDPDKRKAAIQDRELRLQMPGVMLFRRTRADTGGEELLAVFLVGERPTFGVNRVALRVAIQAMHAISSTYQKVYMIGPSFSGSLPGLGQLLSDPKLWLGLEPSPKPFTIISGQTTSTGELDKFEPGNNSTLQTTVNDDRYAINQFLSYVSPPASTFGPDFAVLTEDETAYGHDLQSKKSPTFSRVLIVRYPRGIARLRNAANEIPNLGLVSPGASQNSPADLPQFLKETGEDVIRSFSQQQTPLSSEAVLVNLAGMIRRNKIKYIGVLSTDPLDTIFLLRFLHVACPDVQLVVFTSDLLFARVAHSWSIEGLLAVTTYPLFLENQDFMKPGDPPQRVAFPSEYSEGVYNATRKILEHVDPNNSAPAGMLEYSSPVAMPKGTPPLWLTILGHDSFWPIALLNGQPTAEPSAKVLGSSPDDTACRALPENPSVLWRTIFALVSLYSGAIILAVIIMNAFKDSKVASWLREFAFARNFAFSSGEKRVAARATNIYIILAAVATTSGLFLLALSPLNGMRLPSACCEIIIAFALAESIWILYILFRSKPKWDAKSLITFSLVFSISCAIALICTRISMPATHIIDFFGYRALHPESGVSPILPALILAIGYQYWAFIQLRRLRWIEERGPSTLKYPCVCCTTDIEGGRHAAGEGGKPWFVQPSPLQEDEIESIFGSRTAIASLPFALLWLLLFWPPTHVNSIEPLSYQFFFAILLVVMYAMLIGNWIRFIFLWKDFSQMLHGLESHPLRAAFSRLPADFSWQSIWIGSLRPQMITLTRSYDCLRALLASGIALLPEDQLTQLSTHLQTIEEEQQSGENRYGPGYFQAFNAIEHSYACAAYEAATRLRDHWLKGSSDSIAEHEKAVPPATLSAELQQTWALEEFLALRYVAYIRYVLQQMRNFLEFVTTAFILLAIATVAYPFQGHHSIATAHLILFGVLGTGVVIAFLRMDRDPLLSRLNGSKPNEVGVGFIWRVLSFGSIPLLSLLGSQFPSVRDFLFSWVQPALQAIK